MCYKDEVQKKNTEKLKRKFEEDNVPMFIQFYLLNRKSKLGALNYYSAIKSLLQWLIDKNIIQKTRISDITSYDMKYVESAYINIYLEEKQNEGISPTTLNTRKNIFRSFWKSMVNSPSVPVDCNIVEDVAYEGLDSGYNRYIKMPSKNDLEEMRGNIIRKKKNDNFVRERNLIILTILMNTGLRECELVELEFSSLFLDGNEIEKSPHIRVMGKGVYHIEKGRNILLNSTAKKAFLEWIEVRNTIDIVDDIAVFLNKTGKRMQESDVRAMFKVYSCKKLTPHMIRHWYGTVTTEKYGAAFAQQQLGHKNVNITVNTYVDGGYGIREKLAFE